MFARLKELSGMVKLDVLDKCRYSGFETKRTAVNESLIDCHRHVLRLPCCCKTRGWLIVVEQKDIDWSGLEFRGIELFKNILQVILDKKSVNTAVLIEVYRNTC